MAIELDNSFTVPVPPEQAWDVLLDVERIAPCMPGATVTAVNGDEIEGQVKVKLGPLSLTYKGTAKFTDKDEANRAISIDASGRETRGAGTASATVQASLQPAEAAGTTVVSIHTSLNVTGRPAQFGRSLLPEVSGKLIAQFATNLEALIAADQPTAAAPATATEATEAGPAAAAEAGVPEVGASESGGTESGGAANGSSGAAVPAAPVVKQEESLDAVKFIVIPVLKRVLPVAAAGAVLAFVVRRLTRRKSA